MARVTAPSALQNAKDWEELRRFVTKSLTEITNQINGNLQFIDNILSSGPYTVTFASANTSVAVPHNFGEVPKGYLVIQTTAAMNVFKTPGSGAGIDWTKSEIYLESSAIGTAVIYLV